MWAESRVFGETTASKILKGKLWNRVIRAHKPSYEALWRVLWPLLTKWTKDTFDNESNIVMDLPDILTSKFTTGNHDDASLDDVIGSELVNEVDKAAQTIKAFDAEHHNNPTFRYWRQYMELVSMLLRFTRAIQEGKWNLYLSTFSEMLPYFAAFDHSNYTR